MSGDAVALLAYLWHYLVARLLYDQLIGPLVHGDGARVLALAGIAALAFALGRRSSALGRRTGRRT